MKYFIGIVPPNDIYNTIYNIQAQFGDNRLEPHITLRAPVEPIDVIGWLNSTRSTCNKFAPFQVNLPSTGSFGKNVLFITVQSVTLNEVYNQLIPRLKYFEPIEKEEVRPYHPHLTLGRQWCGFTKEDFVQMETLAKAYLSGNPVSFTASFLRIYYKPGNHSRYEKFEDISLK